MTIEQTLKSEKAVLATREATCEEVLPHRTATRRAFMGSLAAAAGAGVSVSMSRQALAASSSSSSPLLVYLADYSPVGDGVANDTTAVSNALTAAAGKTLVFEESMTYRVTQALTVPANTTLLGKDSTLKFDVNGSVENLVLRDHTTVTNLTVENSGTNPTGAGNYQCPIVIGNYSSGQGYHGIVLRDLTIKSNRTNGNGIFITGDSHDIYISGITMVSATQLGRGILAHWGGAGSPASGTTHPYNITIENVTARDFTYAADDAAVLFFSGCYNVDVSNVDANNVYNGVIGFAGDYGDQYAGTLQKGRSGSGIICRNLVMRSIINRACKVAGKPTISGAAQAWPVSLINCTFIGKSGSENGVILSDCTGVTLDRCKVSYFGSHGLASASGTRQVNVLFGEYDHNGNNGVYCSNGTTAPEDWRIAYAYLHDNNQNANAGSTLVAGIFLGRCVRPVVMGTRIGDASGETQTYGIRTTGDCVSPKLEDNHVVGVKAGGIAYSIGASSDYGIHAHGRNNTAASGITLRGGAPIFVIDNEGHRTFKSSAPPASGTWSRGDRVYDDTPSSGGYTGWVCVSSPNTWKAFGAIA